ncbi:MAG: hypothetical protein IK095_01965, partial [Oscillospiraceae bacterium]|nr:hypothetical protein [Oscillospiraceae bacterium]
KFPFLPLKVSTLCRHLERLPFWQAFFFVGMEREGPERSEDERTGMHPLQKGDPDLDQAGS